MSFSGPAQAARRTLQVMMMVVLATVLGLLLAQDLLELLERRRH